MRLAPSSLRRKVALAILCSTLPPLVVFGAVNYLRTSAGLHHIQNGLLAQSTASVRQDMAQQVTVGVQPYATLPRFGAEVSQGDTAGAAESLRHIVTDLNLVQAQVVDTHGRLLARFSVLSKPRAIGSRGSAPSFQSYLGKLWVVAPIAIRSQGRTGKVVGTLLVAGQIDDDFLQSVSQDVSTPVNVYVNGVLAASSLHGTAAPHSAAGRLRRAQYTADGWTTAYTTLRDSQGHAAGLLSVSTPDSAFTAIRSSMYSTTVLALLLAMAAGVVAAFFIAPRVTRPLRTLSQAAEAIAGGEMRQHIEVNGHDEVAVVAQAFNSMSERVAQTVDELSDQIQDLSRDLAHLSFVGETLAQSHQVVAELSAVADRVREMTHSGFCGVHLLDGEATKDGIYAGTVNGSMLAVEELARWVIAGGDSATTADLALDQRISPLARRSATGIASVMVVPVIHQGRSVGAISVGSTGHLGVRSRHRRRAFDRGQPGRHRAAPRGDLQRAGAQLLPDRHGAHRGDRGKRQVHRRPRRLDRQAGADGGQAARPFGARPAAPRVRRPASRRRQDRHSPAHPRQAGEAERGGVRSRRPAPGDRRTRRVAHRVPPLPRARHPGGARALGRPRLPGRSRRRKPCP